MPGHLGGPSAALEKRHSTDGTNGPRWRRWVEVRSGPDGVDANWGDELLYCVVLAAESEPEKPGGGWYFEHAIGQSNRNRLSLRLTRCPPRPVHSRL